MLVGVVIAITIDKRKHSLRSRERNHAILISTDRERLSLVHISDTVYHTVFRIQHDTIILEFYYDGFGIAGINVQRFVHPVFTLVRSHIRLKEQARDGKLMSRHLEESGMALFLIEVNLNGLRVDAIKATCNIFGVLSLSKIVPHIWQRIGFISSIYCLVKVAIGGPYDNIICRLSLETGSNIIETAISIDLFQDILGYSVIFFITLDNTCDIVKAILVNCSRGENTCMDVSQARAIDAIGKGIESREFPVSGRSIFGEDIDIHLIILSIVGSNETEGRRCRIPNLSFSIQGNQDNRIFASLLGSNGE